MTAEEKRKEFKIELTELLKKYNAELTIENFGRGYMLDQQMVVTFGYDHKLAEQTDNGIIPDLVLGTFMG